MITVHLMGRMGNNLFQVAACLALSRVHQTGAYFTSNHDNIKAFDLTGITYSSKVAGRQYNERKFNFNEDFHKLPNDTHLHGYFQSYKYFEGIKETIYKSLSLKDFVRDNVIANGHGYLEDVTNDHTAIHIRRTDYLSIQHAHPVCSLQYYNDCLDEIKPTGKVLVFSDDLGWCREHFRDRNFEFIDLDHHCCFYMMTRVKNIVIANSSYSWWTAYLNQRPDKAVYAPKRWFGDTLPYRDADINLQNCIKDLFPEGWHQR